MSIYNSGHLAGTFYWTLTTIPCCGHSYNSRLVDENAEFFRGEAANPLPQDREAVAAGAVHCCLKGKPHLYIRCSTRRINLTSVLRHRHAALLHALRTKYPVDRGRGNFQLFHRHKARLQGLCTGSSARSCWPGGCGYPKDIQCSCSDLICDYT